MFLEKLFIVVVIALFIIGIAMGITVIVSCVSEIIERGKKK